MWTLPNSATKLYRPAPGPSMTQEPHAGWPDGVSDHRWPPPIRPRPPRCGPLNGSVADSSLVLAFCHFAMDVAIFSCWPYSKHCLRNWCQSACHIRTMNGLIRSNSITSTILVTFTKVYWSKEQIFIARHMSLFLCFLFNVEGTYWCCWTPICQYNHVECRAKSASLSTHRWCGS